MFCTVIEAYKGLPNPGFEQKVQLQATDNYSSLCSLHFLMLITNAKPCQNCVETSVVWRAAKFHCQAAEFLLHIHLGFVTYFLAFAGYLYNLKQSFESGSRVLMTKNWKKFTVETTFLIFFWSQTTIYLSLGLIKYVQATGKAFKPQENIQYTKTWNFSTFFLFFALLDTDPGSGSTDQIESGSETLIWSQQSFVFLVQAPREDLLHQRGVRGEVGAGHQGVCQVQETGQSLRLQVCILHYCSSLSP